MILIEWLYFHVITDKVFHLKKNIYIYNVTYTTYREVTKIWDDVFEGVVEIQLYKVKLYSVYVVLMDLDMREVREG